MFPSAHVGHSSFLDRQRPQHHQESESSSKHAPPKLPFKNGRALHETHAQSTRPTTSNESTSSSDMTMSSLESPIVRSNQPVFQRVPLPAGNLNLGMLSSPPPLMRAGQTPMSSTIPNPLMQYQAMFPSSEELKYLSMAQIQAANQAHLAGELAKMKPPYVTRNYLELAMLVCNTFRGKLFPCPHCRYVTDRRNNLKRHVATMHQTCDKQLECCGVTFGTKASLREHITIFHHNGYSCTYCGRRFCRKALLKRHLSVHSGQKDYTCPQCDYATSHKSNLERHKRIHARLHLMGASGFLHPGPNGEFLYDDTEDSVSRENSPEHKDIGGSSSFTYTDPTMRRSYTFSSASAEFGFDPEHFRSRMMGEQRVHLPESSEENCDVNIEEVDDLEDDDEVDLEVDNCFSNDSEPMNLVTKENVRHRETLSYSNDTDDLPVNLVTQRNSR